MAEYQEVIHNWRRMCNAVQDSNIGKMGHGWCDNCPIKNECWSNRAVASVAERRMLGVEPIIQKWAEENPEPVYPSLAKYLERLGIIIRRDGTLQADFFKASEPMSFDVAKLLGMKPKEGT